MKKNVTLALTILVLLTTLAGCGVVDMALPAQAQSGPTAVPAPTPGLLSGVKGRIDAVLTTGKLLSFENGACTVYSAAGKKLYRFPLGGLRFCYERWDSAALEFKLYFSLAYWKFADKDGQDELFLEVYALPTADLADLD